MFYLKKRMEIAGAHHLNLPYQSKCQEVHGHNWTIVVYCKRSALDENGMIVDFTKIKEVVMQLDHTNLNDFVEQPTAENIAKFICEQIPYCYRVDVEESQNNEVSYVCE